MNYIATILFIVILMAYFAWRLRKCIRLLRPLDREATYLVYLAVLLVIVLLLMLFPAMPRAAVIALLVIGFGFSMVVSYRINARYQKWLEEKLKNKT